MPELAIYSKGHIKVLRVGDFIGSQQVWPHRQEAISPFSVQPIVEFVPGSFFSCLCEGYGAGGDVVADCISGDVIECVLRGDGFCFFSDNDGKLDFVIELVAVGRPGDFFIGANDCGSRHNEGARDGCFSRGIGQAER